MLDFGLARQFTNSCGDVRPVRFFILLLNIWGLTYYSITIFKEMPADCVKRMDIIQEVPYRVYDYVTDGIH